MKFTMGIRLAALVKRKSNHHLHQTWQASSLAVTSEGKAYHTGLVTPVGLITLKRVRHLES